MEEQVAQYRNQIRGMEDVGASQAKQKQLLQEEHDGLAALSEQGYAASNRVLGLQRQLEEIDGQAAQGRAEMARVENSISETFIQMTQVDREFKQTVLTELREAEGSVNDLTQQLQATREQLGRVEVKAPTAGMIHQLSVFTIGGVVQPGGAVMAVVPQTDRMEFEVDVEPQYVDQIFVEQPADVLFSAFNARTTPTLNGQVIGVSPDSVLNEQLGVAFYKVRLAVSDDELARLGDLRLIPGMPVEVFIQTQSQSPWTYLTRPLSDNLKRAFRED
jgi:HlyD family secretion protein